MLHQKLNIFLASILFILLYFTIPRYNQWLSINLFGPTATISYQMQQMGIEERKIFRYESTYRICKEFSDTINYSPNNKPVILIPPVGFLKQNEIKNFTAIEPATFYYYTALEAVWINSPNVEKANWVLIAENKKIQFKRIADKSELGILVDSFKKFSSKL